VRTEVSRGRLGGSLWALRRRVAGRVPKPRSFSVCLTAGVVVRRYWTPCDLAFAPVRSRLLVGWSAAAAPRVSANLLRAETAPVQDVRVRMAVMASSPWTRTDVVFPPVSSRRALRWSVLTPAPPSESLVRPAQAVVQPYPVGPLEPAGVSDDLLERLSGTAVRGKRYTRSPRDRGAQLTFQFASSRRDERGHRVSFSVERERNLTYGMTIWDLIYPLLQPPLRLDFPRTLDLPSGLYAHQPEAVRFLASRQCALLGDDMGTGKTVEAIVALRILFQTAKVRSALIVCPLSAIEVWEDHLGEWAPCLALTTAHHPSRDQRRVRWQERAHLWLTTYDTLRNDLDTVVAKRQFDLVILDEAQKIRNRETGYAKSVKRLASTYRWALTGTPLENRLEDLLSIFEFLKRGLLAREGVSAAVVKTQIKPFFLRRRKEQVLSLPQRFNIVEWIWLEGSQWETYKRVEQQEASELRALGDRLRVTHVFQLINLLRQVCNADPETGESSKLEWLRDKLEGVVDEDKALVFSNYTGNGPGDPEDRTPGTRWLQNSLRHYGAVRYDGTCSDAQKKSAVDALCRRDDVRILIYSRAGGLGLNLQAANYVFHFDHWWNPAVHCQAEDRVHRIGQPKEVFVYDLWVKGTYEERISEILSRKREVFADVVDALATRPLQVLSEDEWFSVFGLQNPKSRRGAAPPGDRACARGLEDLFAMSGAEFEEFAAGVFRQLGFTVRKTGASGDRGVDLILRRPSVGGTEKVCVQCKCHRKAIGAEAARSLLGVLDAEKSFSKGILVSASGFSQDCREFCSGIGRLELIDGHALLRMQQAGASGPPSS